MDHATRNNHGEKILKNFSSPSNTSLVSFALYEYVYTCIAKLEQIKGNKNVDYFIVCRWYLSVTILHRIRVTGKITERNSRRKSRTTCIRKEHT